MVKKIDFVSMGYYQLLLRNDNGSDYDCQLDRKSSNYGLMVKRNQKVKYIEFQANI